MPSWAPRPVPTSSAVGVARPRAHGQAMIRTATAAVKAVVADPPVPSQKPSVPTARTITTGTNTPETRSASRCTAGLAVLRLLDQPGDLGELGVRTDPGGADDQPAAGVHRRAGHRVARAHLDRHRLAGQQAQVHRGRPVDDHAVGGQLLAGAHQELVAHPELGRGDLVLGAVAQHRHGLGAELQQGPQRVTGPALGAGLEVAPCQQKRGDPGGRLEIDGVATTGGQRERVRHPGHAGVPHEQGPERPAERRQRPDGHQTCPWSRRRTAD